MFLLVEAGFKTLLFDFFRRPLLPPPVAHSSPPTVCVFTPRRLDFQLRLCALHPRLVTALVRVSFRRRLLSLNIPVQLLSSCRPDRSRPYLPHQLCCFFSLACADESRFPADLVPRFRTARNVQEVLHRNTVPGFDVFIRVLTELTGSGREAGK